MIVRGAFIVLEGADRAGKSTQVNLLLNALQNLKITVEKRCFPDRSTAIGSVISNYLKSNLELIPEVVFMLFSANRWESHKDIHKTLESGVSIICDRYAASGAAYAAANTGKDLDWCKQPDKDLPAPDLVVYLDISPELQHERGGYGQERYEKEEMQRKVMNNFRKLCDDSWIKINAGQSNSEIHKQILDAVFSTIDKCKVKPIKNLYES